VARSQGLGMGEDLYHPINEAGLQSFFRGDMISALAGEIVEGLAHGRANQMRSMGGWCVGHSRHAHSPRLGCPHRRT